MIETIMIAIRLVLGILAVSVGMAMGILGEMKENSKVDKDKATKNAGTLMIIAILLVIAIGIVH